jgi:hypothetical protein
VRGHPLRIGMRDALHDDGKPRAELVVSAAPDCDARRRHPLQVAPERAAEHVLERHGAIAELGQAGEGRRVGEVRQLDLHGCADVGEGSLDRVES